MFYRLLFVCFICLFIYLILLFKGETVPQTKFSISVCYLKIINTFFEK